MANVRLAILDDYQRVALDMADWHTLQPFVEVRAFPDHLADHDALVERLRDFQIVVAMRERTPFPKSLIDRLPKLKLIVSTGMRNASIDLAAARAANVWVCGTETLEYPAAEMTWALLLASARQIPYEDRAMREGRWQSTLGVGLRGKTLGLLGLGKLGRQVAAYGRAFQMEVIAWSENLTDERAASVGVTRVKKDELFACADFVSIHLVLGPRTRGLVGPPELARMKPTARLVNTSRGPIVDQTALIAALESRRIAGAALDVFDQEPLPATHPLRTLDNVVLTPHLGYVTMENYLHAYGQAFENVRAFLQGQRIRVLQAAPGSVSSL